MSSALQPISAHATDVGGLEQMLLALDRVKAECDRLAEELLTAKAKAGDLQPPGAIEDTLDARAWLAWARASYHQEGCLCHRCPAARKLLARQSSVQRTDTRETEAPTVVAVCEILSYEVPPSPQEFSSD